MSTPENNPPDLSADAEVEAKQQRALAEMRSEVQKVIKAMSPSQKLRAAERLYFSARQLKAAGLRAQHPEWSEETIEERVREVFLYARS